MKYDIVLAGVGGQGVLSLAAAIATAAMREGLALRQSEVHGMAQRGGGVSAHLRMSSSRVASDLIPRGGADMILSMEPLEALRCLPWLREGGVLVSAAEPLVNIPDYPDLEGLHAAIRSLGRSVLVQVQELAKAAGNARAANTVLVGAASPHLPIKPESLEEAIREAFAQKGRATVEANLAAFRAGRSAGAGVGGTGA